MPDEPAPKRVYAFVDCQNLFGQAREVFNCRYPDFDPQALAGSICTQQAGNGWVLSKLHVYTGIHDPAVNQEWYDFWHRKLGALASRGVQVFSRQLRYIRLPDGTRKGREKGIDVRIALDVVRFAIEEAYDVALIFSQDQDLNEVAAEVRRIASLQGRWIKLASAYPFTDGAPNKRGIDGTDWIRIDLETYRACVDSIDYKAPLLDAT